MERVPDRHRELYSKKLTEVYGASTYKFHIFAIGKRGIVGLAWRKERVELVRMILSPNEDEIFLSIDAKFDPEKIHSEFDRMCLLSKNLYETDYKRLIN
ncbi:hypothetical protein ACQP3R_08730 [Bacillus inaquosorum]|uniref:hypothetical protein n=1 Tax=Bacillus inaquosorum TaxID=483913 RepID=UPI003D032C83